MNVRLCCGNCRELVRLNERVYLDEINTVIHMRCYHSSYAFRIKDRGTYREIIEKYSFFDDLKPHLSLIK